MVVMCDFAYHLYFLLCQFYCGSFNYRLSLEKRVDLAEKGLKKVNISIENLKLSVDRHDEQNDYTKSW